MVLEIFWFCTSPLTYQSKLLDKKTCRLAETFLTKATNTCRLKALISIDTKSAKKKPKALFAQTLDLANSKVLLFNWYQICKKILRLFSLLSELSYVFQSMKRSVNWEKKRATQMLSSTFVPFWIVSNTVVLCTLWTIRHEYVAFFFQMPSCFRIPGIQKATVYKVMSIRPLATMHEYECDSSPYWGWAGENHLNLLKNTCITWTGMYQQVLY